MGRRHNRIWRQLRSARVSALSDEERRDELLEAERRRGRGGVAAATGPRLACAVCGERFVVTPAHYGRCSGAVECPACGSLDLVLLEDERATSP
jgi:hypothetical protein